MKKLIVIIMLLFISVMVAGCKGSESDFTLTKDMIVKNIGNQENNIPVQKNAILSADIAMDAVVNQSYFNTAGLIIFEDEHDKIGCYSLFINNALFPNIENGSVQIKSVNFNGETAHYVEAYNSDNEVTVYDVFGNVVVETGKYHTLVINGRTKAIYDEEGEFVRDEYIETIVTLTVSDFLAGNLKPFISENVINILDGTRTPYTDSNEEEYYRGSGINEIDLKNYGLDGYKGSIIDSYLFVYDNTNKLVSKINIKDTVGGGFVNGKLIYQTVYNVDIDSKDYTYMSNGDKYLLNSYVVDILTGEVKELKLKYLFNSFVPYMDENGNIKWVFAEIKEITSKNLANDSSFVIIDDKGEIVYEVGPFNLPRLKQLSDNYFYDSESRTVLDSELNPLYTFSVAHSINILDDAIIVLKDGRYGAIDFDGRIIIPFEYTSLSNYVYNGKRLARHYDNYYYFINADGTKEDIDIKYYRITPGLLYSAEYDLVSEKYNVDIVDYGYNLKLHFSYNNVWSSNFSTSFTNIYGRYLINRYTVDDFYKYVIIDITTD